MSQQAVRFSVLDGWRGIAILLVLATHLLPLGPKSWQLNATFGPAGMALFFVLSGFLITNSLSSGTSVTNFLVRRSARIVPLAWLYTTVALLWVGADGQAWLAHLFFYANWPPVELTGVTAHLWSLCVEMQFYVGIALLAWLLGERGLYLVLPLCAAVTLFRVLGQVQISIATYYRVDEILAGSLLALAYNRQLGNALPRLFCRLNPYILIPAFIISCHPSSGWMNYLRPYLAMMLVGWSLFNPERTSLHTLLNKRWLAYVAVISYALYVLHPLLAHTWLGSGETWERYAKRPLLFVALFVMAHASTFHFERWFISWGKRYSMRSLRADNLRAV
jgi:peptidoglycan/LPS O-acetylase OafA/YrhL